MFDARLCDRRLTQQMDVLRQRRPGLAAADYTTAQAQDWMARLAPKQGQSLTREEEDFVLATLARSKADFRWWAERFAYVKTKELTKEPMALWESQRFILDKVAEREWHLHTGGSGYMWFQTLKGRQLGASSLIQAIIAHKTFFYGNVNGLIAADVQTQSAYLFDMLERTFENLPWWMAPRKLEHTKSEEIKFSTDSNVWVGWGKSKRGARTATGTGSGELGRGRSLHVAHLSEISTWEDPSQITDALEPALSKSRNAFCAMESSPKGRNWWYTKWQQSVNGLSDWVPVFVGWYTEPSLRLSPPEGWTPLADTLAHAAHVERVSAQWNKTTIRLTREQMYWWERKYLAAREDRTLYKFLAEFAADPETCFTLADTSVFSTEALLEQRSLAKPLQAVVEVYQG